MFRRFSFVFLFLLLLPGLAWWADLERSRSTSGTEKLAPHPEVASIQTVDRSELVETLDRIVAYEHYYHSVYGHFTQLLNRIGFSIPSGLMELYEIRVSEATQDRLLITAFSEVNGRIVDLVSIDQDYQVHANFRLPAPRAEYVRTQAMKHLRLLRNAPSGQSLEEEGVYKGFFRYDVRTDSQGGRSAFAVGVRPPVVGLQLELGQQTEESMARAENAELLVGAMDDTAGLSSTKVGQESTGDVMTSLEEAYLAQKIFHGEYGRYAKSWSELSKIASFHFAGKEQGDHNEEVPFGDAAPNSGSPERRITSVIQRDGLEIEPIR